MAGKKKTAVRRAAKKPTATTVSRKRSVALSRRRSSAGGEKKPARAATRKSPVAERRAPASPPPAATGKRARKLSAKDLDTFRKLLLNLRDRIVDGISFLAGDNLNHSQREASGDLSNYGIHMADQGTDNFDREFALSLVSNEQEVLYEIDEALHRIESGTYGICEMTGQPIEIERLKVLPYARYCREAQEQIEKKRKRFRPFATAGIPGGISAAPQDS